MRRVREILGCCILLCAAIELRGGELAWERTVVALTAEPGQTVVSADFPVRNGSDHPIRITSLQAGCDCTTATAQPELIAPGGRGVVHVVLKAGEVIGRRSESIQVATNAPTAAPDELTLKVVFPAGVSVSPPVLHWEVGGRADAQTAICLPEPNATRITGVEPNPNFDTWLDLITPGPKFAWRIRPKSTARPLNATLFLDLKTSTGRTYHFPLHAWIIPPERN